VITSPALDYALNIRLTGSPDTSTSSTPSSELDSTFSENGLGLGLNINNESIYSLPVLSPRPCRLWNGGKVQQSEGMGGSGHVDAGRGLGIGMEWCIKDLDTGELMDVFAA
jgi:hypothetical protein